jgi:hypothetical protein
MDVKNKYYIIEVTGAGQKGPQNIFLDVFGQRTTYKIGGQKVMVLLHSTRKN